jgi:hypothetical protein
MRKDQDIALLRRIAQGYVKTAVGVRCRGEKEGGAVQLRPHQDPALLRWFTCKEVKECESRSERIPRSLLRVSERIEYNITLSIDDSPQLAAGSFKADSPGQFLIHQAIVANEGLALFIPLRSEAGMPILYQAVEKRAPYPYPLFPPLLQPYWASAGGNPVFSKRFWIPVCTKMTNLPKAADFLNGLLNRPQPPSWHHLVPSLPILDKIDEKREHI